MEKMQLNTKSLQQDTGKFKKILKMVQKTVSKEFLWILFVVILSIPLALIVSYIISTDAKWINAQVAKDFEEVAQIISTQHPRFTVVFGLCAAGIYFARMVTAAVKNMLEDKK